MAKLITLDGLSFTKPGLPIAYNEPLLSAGSLMLLDPTHPMDPWGAGVPTDGAVLPNIAAGSLALLKPASTETQLNAEVNNVFSQTGQFERTAKGGLHGIIKQNTYITPLESNGMFLKAMREYIAANPTHNYYHGLYGRITRKDNNTVPNAAGSLTGIINTGGTDYFTIRPASSNTLAAAPSAQRLNHTVVGSNTPGLFRVSGEFANLAGTPGTSDLLVRWTNGHQQSGTVVNASWVLYSYYVEDLTVSGRTYAQVDALRSAAYTADVLTAGGRYYGDTFTDPLTV